MNWSFRSLLGSFLGLGLGRGQRRRPRDAKKLPQRRLNLEPLEHRTLLSVTWTGGGGNNYTSNPANWQGNVAPVAGVALPEMLVSEWR
jgi:hypothetical protein